MQDTIVLYPFPEIGHIVSMVELSKLILHHKNFSIIILTISSSDAPSYTSYIHHISHTYPSISFHYFPPLSINKAATPPRSRAAEAFEFIRLNTDHAFHSLQEISKTSRISGFVIDFFCTSALPLARKLGISTYYFFTSGAAALAAFLYLPTVHQQHSESLKDLPNTIIEFPGLPCIKATHMAEPMLDRNDPAYNDMLYFISHLPKSDGIIVNTFEDLEQDGVKSLKDGVCSPGIQIPPIYYIGPLISHGKDQIKKEASVAEQDYLSWLDAQPKKSVVFLCFGSRGTFSVEQVREIATALERSGYRFLWVLKNPTGEIKSTQTNVTTQFSLDDVLPQGFRERTRDRGRVVKSWAPQVEILTKVSVAAFVTHCGWNSILEAVVAGVPMVAWPLYAEQHMNKVFLVEDMKMAVPVEQKEDGMVNAYELEQSLTELMESEGGRELRERSRKMRDLASAAWSENGSSTRDLARLAEILRKS